MPRDDEDPKGRVSFDLWSARGLRRLVAATAVAAVVVAANAGGAGAITSGQADGDGHPYVGALVKDFGRFCSGTLVAPRIVVTAAHCLSAEVDPDVSVNFDSVYVHGESMTIHGTGVAAVDPAIFRGSAGAGAQHGNSDLGDDVAVVHLDEAPPIDQFARLPAAGLLSSLDLRGRTFTAVGYGRTRVDETKGPNNFEFNREPSVRHVALESFASLQSGALTVSQNPSRGDGGTCFGDSGGPHFLDDSDLLVATTSQGDAVCRATGRHYRLDTDFARRFLASQGVPLPE